MHSGIPVLFTLSLLFLSLTAIFSSYLSRYVFCIGYDYATGTRCYPDILGTYIGIPFVVDTKLHGNRTYISEEDISKLQRDARATGRVPVLIHGGVKISRKRKYQMQYFGSYIQVC